MTTGRLSIILVAAGTVAAMTGLALSQHWLAVADLLPLLFVLPCALMMGMCMKGMSRDQPAENSPKDVPAGHVTNTLT
jgi:hypothetical protein